MSKELIPKRKEKVKITISISKKLYKKIVEVRDLSEGSVSGIISHLCRKNITIDKVLEHYRNKPKEESEED